MTGEMKVLFVSPAARLGGAERSLLDMIKALRRLAPECEPALVAFETGPLLACAAELECPVHVLPLPERLAASGEGTRRSRIVGGAWSGVVFMRRLRELIAREAPDVVHTNGIKAHVLASAVTLRPTVFHFRDFMHDRVMSRRVLRPLTVVGRRMALANSLAVARDVETCFPGLIVRPVHNVVDLSEFAPATGDPAWLASAAQMSPPPEGTMSFGLAATYAYWKGHELFLQAAALLRKRRPELSVRFYVIGGPIYSTAGSQVSDGELRRLVERLGLDRCVGFVPFQSKMAPVYRALDVVVHASTRPEPFGRTIAEAMACGKPVLVANEGGAPELFTAGVSAIAYQPRSIAALSDAMEAVSTRPEWARELGRRARDDAAHKFDPARLATDLTRTYSQVTRKS
jgi:glycosyltransferase involved in cell wall biosynthesis